MIYLVVSPPIITQDITEMAKCVQLTARHYKSLTIDLSAFPFVTNMAIVAKNMHMKASLWYKDLRGNFRPSMVESDQFLETDGSLIHVDWVTEKSESEGLAAFLDTIFLDTHPLVSDLLSFIRNNAW